MDKTDNSRGSRNEIDLLSSVGKSTNWRSAQRKSIWIIQKDEIRKVEWMSKIEEQAQSGDDRTGLDESQLCFISLSAFDSGR